MSPARISAWKRAKHRVAHSIKLRMVLLFLLLAAAMTFVFFTGAQRAFSMGWREAVRPLVGDYVQRLAAEIGSPPSVARAQALVQRLPISVVISGPEVNWRSEPEAPERRGWRHAGHGTATRSDLGRDFDVDHLHAAADIDCARNGNPHSQRLRCRGKSGEPQPWTV